MKHYGDITKINGAEVPSVDIITGGSPCQDLSVAGKRAGLAGERSGLFMEQIRIIKEMRENDRRNNGRADNACRPRYMVWENVPGAFTSNKGEDFRAVLEETAKVADPDAVIPEPPSGKWTHAGAIMGDGWSIAWRVHDAQFWGVPQRRRRISLVADFGGYTAPEILFERESVPGNTKACGKEGKDITENIRRSVTETGRTYDVRISSDGTKNWRAHAYPTDICRNLDTGGVNPDSNHGGICVIASDITPKIDDKEPQIVAISSKQQGLTTSTDIAATLGANDYKEPQAVVYGISAYDSNAMKSANPHSGVYEAETTRTLDLNGGNPACNQGGMAVVCIENHPQDSRVKIREGGIVQTLNARMGMGGNNVPMVLEPTTVSHGGFMVNADNSGKAHTLEGTDYKDAQVVAYRLDRAAYNQGMNALYDFSVEEEKIGPQTARGPGAVYSYQNVVGTVCACIGKGTSNQLATDDMFVANTSIARRLTPLECERLQGFPDGWTDIGDWTDSKGRTHKGESDAPRYKALGNSIALPFWQWMAERMVAYLGDKPTMASLFDGIGEFPLVFSRAGCIPVWASEIEEFPIAVTRLHFPD